MILISHRGNLNGKNLNRENKYLKDELNYQLIKNYLISNEEFFKKTDSILEQFIIEEPKEKEVSDEEKVSKGSDK